MKDRLTSFESSLDELREEMEGHPHRMKRISVKVYLAPERDRAPLSLSSNTLGRNNAVLEG